MQTAFCCSSQAFTTVLLLFLGLIAASIHLQNESSQLGNSIISPPMIAMANQQEAWSGCIGMTVDDCKNVIVSSTGGDIESVVIKEEFEVSSSFQQNILQIFVNQNGIVIATLNTDDSVRESQESLFSDFQFKKILSISLTKFKKNSISEFVHANEVEGYNLLEIPFELSSSTFQFSLTS